MKNNYPNIKPIGDWVYIRKQEDHGISEGGIHLPENTKIPNTRAKILAIGPFVGTCHFSPIGQIEDDEDDDMMGKFCPEFKVGDTVILHFRSDFQPVTIEGDKGLLLVPSGCIIAKVGAPNLKMANKVLD